MANLIKKASEALRKENRKQTLRRFNERVDTERLTLSACSVAGAAGAGFIDRKWAEVDDVARVKGVPVNLAIGAVGVAATIALKKFPGRSVAGGLALGQLCAATYRLVLELKEESPAE